MALIIDGWQDMLSTGKGLSILIFEKGNRAHGLSVNKGFPTMLKAEIIALT
jgi:hypothetical protein